MPTYVYWGEDDFARNQAVLKLKQAVLDPDWASFNFDRIPADQPNGTQAALTQAMTPPFGLGQRLVWLVDPSFFQQCPEDLTQELARTLPQVPESTVLVMTHSTKPNGRLKATKLLQKYAEIEEFSPIPPWKTEELAARLRSLAKTLGVRLSREGGEFLVEAVGNDTRQLYNELEKLRLFAGQTDGPLDLATVASLVTTSTQSTLQLASAIRQGQIPKALELLSDLLGRNEPALRIVATLVSQFRTWLWIKVMLESGERDNRAIATAAGIGNPNRIYFLQQEIRHLSQTQLLQALPLLLALEAELKLGQEELATLQTKIIELCTLCAQGTSAPLKHQ